MLFLKKKFLLTGFYFDGFHGSMMHICELANALNDMGFDVSIVVMNLTDKIYKYVMSKVDAKIYTLEDFDYSFYYDYVLAYHDPIITYLISKNLKYGKLAIGALSYFLNIEQPSLLAKYGYPLFVNSQEVKQFFQNKYNISSTVLVNSVPVEYLEFEKKVLENLRKILVVSNHVPKELLEASKILMKKGYRVDFRGDGFKYSPVNAGELLEYDVIITIGKTVQYALFLGIPVYNYDYFGGIGYINSSNIDNEEFYNFSGRSCRRKLSPEEIVEELEKGYDLVKKGYPELTLIAENRYNLKHNLVNIIKIMNSSGASLPDTVEWDLYSARCIDFCEALLLKNRKIKSLQKLTYLFYKIVNILSFGHLCRNIISNGVLR